MKPLQTKRLQFSDWKLSDLDDARSLWGDPKVMELIVSNGVLTPEEVAERLSREMQCQEKWGIQYWKLITLDNFEFIGCCGLRRWLYTDELEPAFELGFHIRVPHWGKGYASEAARAVVKLAFEAMNVPLLFAGHHPNNTASKAVLSKLGFKMAGQVLYPPTGLQHPYYRLLPSQAKQIE